MSTPPSEQEKQKDRLGKAAAALAVGGVIWIGLMSLLVGWVYEPVGVSPRDLGLSSSAQIGQAATGLAVYLLLVMALAAAITLCVILWQPFRDSEISEELKRLDFEEKVDHSWRMVVIALWISGLLAIPVGAAAVLIAAGDGRAAIKEGRQPGFILSLPPPWSAFSADVHSLGSSSGRHPKFPACALYLGQADGTVVLRTSEETIRLPASTVRLDLKDRQQCPEGKSDQDSSSDEP